MHYVRFLAAFVVYTVIDVGWNISPIARGMYESLYEASGNDSTALRLDTQEHMYHNKYVRSRIAQLYNNEENVTKCHTTPQNQRFLRSLSYRPSS